MSNNKTNWGEWSIPVNGLQMRGRFVGKTPNEANAMTIEIELKNISSSNILVFDFQDEPTGWPVTSSYLRGMLIGIKGRKEPHSYHLLSSEIEKIIELAPGESYLFHQKDIPSSWQDIQFIYDTKVVQDLWPGNYWKGRIETSSIYLEQK